MADGRGSFQPLAAQAPSRWLSRPSACCLSVACSVAAFLALGGAAAIIILRLSLATGRASLRGAPLALFSESAQADVHCEEVVSRMSYAEDRLLTRSAAAAGYAAKGKAAAVSPFYGGEAKGGASAGGILDFSVGRKNPYTHGVLNWQGAAGAQQELKSIAQFRAAFKAGAAGATKAAEKARVTAVAAVSPSSGRMLDQCRQLSDNNIIADAVRSRDGEVLDLTFRYALRAGRDANATRPVLQHTYWAPTRCATCSTPFAGDGGRPSTSLPTRMEPGIMYTFHCSRSEDCEETVDVSVVTDAGLFQAAMLPVRRPPVHVDTPPRLEGGSSAEGGAESGRLHRDDLERLGDASDADRAALGRMLEREGCSICQSCGGEWPHALVTHRLTGASYANLPGAGCGARASWEGSWALCCAAAGAPRREEGNTSSV